MSLRVSQPNIKKLLCSQQLRDIAGMLSATSDVNAVIYDQRLYASSSYDDKMLTIHSLNAVDEVLKCPSKACKLILQHNHVVEVFL
jgi:hypothetical protein